MKEMNKMISDDELEYIVGGYRDECLEIMQWCMDHGAGQINLPAPGNDLDPAELLKAYNFLYDKIHNSGMQRLNFKMPNKSSNSYQFYDSELKKHVAMNHSEFMDFLNKRFG